LTSRLAPLWAFHTHWLQQQQADSKMASEWWEGMLRHALVTAAVTRREDDIALAAHLAEEFTNKISTVRNIIGSVEEPNTSSSSSESSIWKNGDHDYHPYCSVCAQEQWLQQRRRGCSSSSSSSSDPAVHYIDPFMWRRLLWQLLGKLSPEAQAFYAQHLAVCPHCPDDK
jgi:hypothetical protein